MYFLIYLFLTFYTKFMLIDPQGNYIQFIVTTDIFLLVYNTKICSPYFVHTPPWRNHVWLNRCHMFVWLLVLPVNSGGWMGWFGLGCTITHMSQNAYMAFMCQTAPYCICSAFGLNISHTLYCFMVIKHFHSHWLISMHGIQTDI